MAMRFTGCNPQLHIPYNCELCGLCWADEGSCATACLQFSAGAAEISTEDTENSGGLVPNQGRKSQTWAKARSMASDRRATRRSRRPGRLNA